MHGTDLEKKRIVFKLLKQKFLSKNAQNLKVL